MNKLSLLIQPRLLVSFLFRKFYAKTRYPGQALLFRDHIRKWLSHKEVVVRSRYGFWVAAAPYDYVGCGIFCFDEYDPEMTNLIRSFVRPGFTAWDVGSERGWFSMVMAHGVGPTGRVDAFEAFPPNHKKLTANLDRNQFTQVRANCLAVGGTTGSLWFVPPEDVPCVYSNCGGIGYLSDHEVAGASPVPCIRLDDYARDSNLTRLDLIKMDIEGAEVDAIRGAAETIRRFHPILMVEYNRGTLRRSGKTMPELDELIESLGYDRFIYNDRFLPLRLADWDGKSDEETVFNVYCFPRQR